MKTTVSKAANAAGVLRDAKISEITDGADIYSIVSVSEALEAVAKECESFENSLRKRISEEEEFKAHSEAPDTPEAKAYMEEVNARFVAAVTAKMNEEREMDVTPVTEDGVKQLIASNRDKWSVREVALVISILKN